jgi:hypothetical protein
MGRFWRCLGLLSLGGFGSSLVTRFRDVPGFRVCLDGASDTRVLM